MKEKKTIENNNGDFLNPQLSIENMDIYFVRKSILKAITENLPEFYGTLLDIGCGEMPYKQILTSLPGKVEKYIGLDIENPTYQQNTNPDLFWDGKIIPIEDDSVDCVVATEFFEHIPYPEKILAEVIRVLKPGGILFLTVPFIWPLHTMPYDEYRYTPFSLERILKNSGFDNISLKSLGGWDASLAQVIGLWARRRPMSNEDRFKYSKDLFPFYKSLIDRDQIPTDFTESILITGLTGTARKNIIQNSDSDLSDEIK